MKIDNVVAFRITCVFALMVGVAVVVISLANFDKIAARSPRIRALAHAKQVHLGLMEYAIDHDYTFPVATSHSNAAFRQLSNPLRPGYYIVPGSAWCAEYSQDDKSLWQSSGGMQRLGPGENHWAYASGLTAGSKGNLPIVMDGFSETIGVYVNDPDKRGGVWRQEAAVIVRVDGSSGLEKPGLDGRIYEMKSGWPVDIFSSDYGTDPSQLLNPW
ncbi:MAG: hypothetical protein O3C21_02265 [Verrucomicrobia bacterium]|nr:hypothetical protein [Verrucomicrobiota bacterium]